MSAAVALSGLAASFLSRVDAAPSSGDLDAIASDIYRHFGWGQLSEDDAKTLQDRIIERRGPPRASAPPRHGHPIGTALGRARALSLFPSRRHQRSPDRAASRARRRKVAVRAPMPPAIQEAFTEGERAAMTVIAWEVERHGVCDLVIDRIAAQSGCSRTTVRNAVREARRLGLVRVTERRRVGQKNLPNLISIISPAWLAWIKRRRSEHKPIGVKVVSSDKNVSPTKNIDTKQKAFNEGRHPGQTAGAIGGHGRAGGDAGASDPTSPAAAGRNGWHRSRAGTGLGPLGA